MSGEALFSAAFPFAEDVLDLPVQDLDEAVEYYGSAFGLVEIERYDDPPRVVMERDGVQIGFGINVTALPARRPPFLTT